MNTDDALRALDMPPDVPYRRDDVVSAFAARAKALHPDVVGLDYDPAVSVPALKRAKEARDHLLRGLADATPDAPAHDEPCPMCNGKGIVRKGFRHSQCSNCDGTGVRLTTTKRRA